MTETKDLASKEHWDAVYQSRSRDFTSEPWTPKHYDMRCLEAVFSRQLTPEISTVLEIGCGNSQWLAWFARQNRSVSGVDYSELGCDMARLRTKAQGCEVSIHCGDMFKISTETVGLHDLVYSIGVVEHFSDTTEIVRSLSRFVKPGGCLLTVIPNLRSMHGLMAWLYQPELLAKHYLLSRAHLEKSYKLSRFLEVNVSFLGAFSLNVVAWGHSQRMPGFDRWLLPFTKKLSNRTERLLKSSRSYNGNFLFSPFICAVGKLPDDARRRF
ncbi:MAG: class I SAM-dependent methyltransferase [Desulfuromonadales bacterium]|nr:class I SAM-dependent methyltransferase [Desulfuromonadales bacterium]